MITRADAGTQRAFFWHEWSLKRFQQVKTPVKVLALVGLLFPEHLFLDEMKDHVTHVLALAQAPFTHQGGCHRAEFIKRVIAESVEQFLAGDVAGTPAILFRNAFEREIQRVLEKEIRKTIKAPFALQDGVNGLFELHGLHVGMMRIFSPRVKAHCRKPT